MYTYIYIYVYCSQDRTAFHELKVHNSKEHLTVQSRPANMYTYIYIHTHVCMYVCMCIDMCVCIYIYIYTQVSDMLVPKDGSDSPAKKRRTCMIRYDIYYNINNNNRNDNQFRCVYIYIYIYIYIYSI